jgi:hypothetical protein
VSVAGGGPRARRKSSGVGCPCPRLGSGEARSRPLNGPILDLIAPIRPLQLCADGGYQLRFRSLEGTPNYGPRQLYICIIYYFDRCLIFVGTGDPMGDPYPHGCRGKSIPTMYMSNPTGLFFLSCVWVLWRNLQGIRPISTCPRPNYLRQPFRCTQQLERTWILHLLQHLPRASNPSHRLTTKIGVKRKGLQ